MLMVVYELENSNVATKPDVVIDVGMTLIR